MAACLAIPTWGRDAGTQTLFGLLQHIAPSARDDA